MSATTDTFPPSGLDEVKEFQQREREKHRVMRLLDQSFKYANAEQSREPGYLARKFAAIRRRQQKEAA